jgi:hypothetical protein
LRSLRENLLRLGVRENSRYLHEKPQVSALPEPIGV